MSEQLKILNEFYNKNKDNKLILSKDEIKQKTNKWLSSSEYYLNSEVYKKYLDEIIFGIDDGLCFTEIGVGYHDGTRFTFSEIDYEFFIISVHPVFEYSITGNDVKKCLFGLKEREKLFLNLKTTLLDPIKKLNIKQEEEERKGRKEEEEKKEEKRLKELQVSQTNVLSELDKDGNGVIDVIEGDDFNQLLKKHQKQIIEMGRNDNKSYVQQFVKLSNFLNTKKGNIQHLFDSVKDIPNQELLSEYIKVVKNNIHSYEVLLINSLNMICVLVEDDLITFYSIYEKLDKLNIFNSNHENEMLSKLSDIEGKLEDIIHSIDDMNNSIVMELGMLSMEIENSTNILSTHLKEIESSIDVNTFITGIGTYQMYQINKNNKSLN
jgi:hypothetical protein